MFSWTVKILTYFNLIIIIKNNETILYFTTRRFFFFFENRKLTVYNYFMPITMQRMWTISGLARGGLLYNEVKVSYYIIIINDFRKYVNKSKLYYYNMPTVPVLTQLHYKYSLWTCTYQREKNDPMCLSNFEKRNKTPSQPAADGNIYK